MTTITPPLPSPIPDRLIGRGRRASVWAAHHDGTEVAWKRYDDAQDPALARERRARAAAHHARLVPMLASTSDGFVMPLATVDLATSVRQVPLPAESLATLLRDVGGALAALHAAEWVHGDIAPTNIVLTPGGWSLTDLDQSGPVVDPPVGVGTPGYVAPEVAAGGHGSVAADVHAFAATLLAAAHGRGGLPASWHAVLDAALAVDPADRPTLDEVLALVGETSHDEVEASPLPAATSHIAAGPVPRSPAPASTAPASTVPIARTVEFGPVRRDGPDPATSSVSWHALIGVVVLLAEGVMFDGQQLALTIALQAPPAIAVLGRQAWEAHDDGHSRGQARAERRPRTLAVAWARARRELLDSLDAGEVVDVRSSPLT